MVVHRLYGHEHVVEVIRYLPDGMARTINDKASKATSKANGSSVGLQ